MKKAESNHEDVHEDKQLHVDEVQPNEEVNMFPKMNGEPRKRFKSVVLKTPWTTYSRRKPKKPKNYASLMDMFLGAFCF